MVSSAFLFLVLLLQNHQNDIQFAFYGAKKEIKPMLKTIFLLVLLCLSSPSYGEIIYQWVDKNGTFNFTDDPERVPTAYREKVQQKVIEDILETRSILPPATQIPAEKKVVKRDNLGLGQEWWREKAHPLKEQLKEGMANLEVAKNKFMEESEKLILRKYGSHQQFKSTILDMDRTKGYKSKYEAQINETKELLKKLSEEAEALKADPVWIISASIIQRDTGADIYGRDGTWWRSKVSDLREELKKTIESYEEAYENYNKYVEKLAPSRFGRISLTQYQLFSYRLNILSEELGRHQDRMIEASERLKRLLKEAEESKANPEWLRE
jgi:hypothetical protein